MFYNIDFRLKRSFEPVTMIEVVPTCLSISFLSSYLTETKLHFKSGLGRLQQYLLSRQVGSFHEWNKWCNYKINSFNSPPGLPDTTCLPCAASLPWCAAYSVELSLPENSFPDKKKVYFRLHSCAIALQFLKMGQTRPLFHLFLVFSNKQCYNFYNK